jgi:chromosomal replication initiator protein
MARNFFSKLIPCDKTPPPYCPNTPIERTMADNIPPRATLSKEKIWNEVLESIKVTASPAIFKTWLAQTHLSSLRKIGSRYQAEIGCGTIYVKDTIERRYFGLLQDALIKSLGNPADLTFTVKETFHLQKNSSTPLFEDSETKEELARALANARIRPGFNFKNFAVSGTNQLAYAAALAVADKPGQAYNPLFIWGGVGVGKTHLMHAVGYKLLEKNLGAKIVSCTAEEFTNDIVQGIRNKTTQVVRDKYRKVDALFIDDIQFIAGKDKAQEEFFHSFNAVVGAGNQVILTSDRPPSETNLEDRLTSRFEAGLTVDISEPDFELRCAIVQIKASQNNIELPIDLVHLIAGNISSARKIEGYIIRLMSELKIKGLTPNEEIVMSIIGKPQEGRDIKKSLFRRSNQCCLQSLSNQPSSDDGKSPLPNYCSPSPSPNVSSPNRASYPSRRSWPPSWRPRSLNHHPWCG